MMPCFGNLAFSALGPIEPSLWEALEQVAAFYTNIFTLGCDPLLLQYFKR